MPHKIWKHCLSPGTYWASVPDPQTGEVTTEPVEFTAEDVRRFYQGGKRLLDLGYPIPVPLEHDPGAGPVALADRNAARVANNTGWVGDLRLVGDPASPELWTRCDVDGIPGVPDAEVPRHLQERVKFVSPDLWPELTLGSGHTIQNAIRHVALTCQPIDYAQKPFGAVPPIALSMASVPQVIRLWSTAPVRTRMSLAFPFEMAAHHAPKGGITVNGTFYKGGRFIPNSELEKDPEAKNRLEGAKKERGEKLKSGGDVDLAALRGLIAKGGRTRQGQKMARDRGEKPGDLKGALKGFEEYANRAWASLKDHHGDALIHRIRQLVEKDVADLQAGKRWAANGKPLLARLAVANHWIDRYEREQQLGQPDAGGVDGTGDGRPAKVEQRIVTAREHLTAPADPGVVPEVVRGHLRDHQVQGAAKVIAGVRSHGAFLLGDGPGAGKTRQMLAAAQAFVAEGKKVLIVQPNSVLAPQWEEGTFSGSLADDSRAIGVDVRLASEDLGAGEIGATTYHRLAEALDLVDKDTVVMFDEAHNLKNADSKQSQLGDAIAKNAGGVVLASATLADTYEELAYTFQKQLFPDQSWANVRKHFSVDRHGAAEVYRRVQAMYDDATARGLMLKREISLDGVDVAFDQVPLAPEDHAVVESAMSAEGSPKMRAQALMAARAALETRKITHATKAIQEELAAGRSVVVFASRVNADANGEGTPALLRQALEAAGLSATDVVEWHGGQGADDAAVQKFQANQAKVFVTTSQSGGTGINLHDVTGDRPRTQLWLTPPFSGIDVSQMWGRTWRIGTKTRSKIRHVHTDSPIDQWNVGLAENKMRALGAVMAGETDRIRLRQETPDATRPGEPASPPLPVPMPAAARTTTKTSPIQPGMRRDATPPSASAVAEAVKKVASQHSGLADLVHVRKELAQAGIVDRAQQDSLIDQAREQGLVTGSDYEGRGGISQEQVAARHGKGMGSIGYLAMRSPAANPAPDHSPPPSSMAAIPPGHTVIAEDPAQGLRVAKDSQGQRTTLLDPEHGRRMSVELAPSLRDSLSEAQLYQESAGGLIPLPLFVEIMKQKAPQATLGDVLGALNHLRKSKRLQMHVLNEVKLINPQLVDGRNDGTGIRPIEGAKTSDTATLWDRERAHHFIALHPGQTVDDVFTPVVAGTNSTRAQMSLNRGGRRVDSKDDLFDVDELTDDDQNATTKSSSRISDAIAELADLGIIVEPSDDSETFLDHLCTALKTHKATKAGGMGGGTIGTAASPSEPAVVQMSMALRQQKTETDALRSDLAEERLVKVLGEIDALVASGRMPPAEARPMKEQFGSRKLSLVGASSDPAVERFRAVLEAYRRVPEGTFWSSEQKRAAMSQAAAAPRPDWSANGALPPDRVDAILNEIHGSAK